MQSNEYPKMLYGPKGWGDLNDHRVVGDADQEESARNDGFSELGKLPDEDADTSGAAPAAATRKTRKPADTSGAAPAAGE